MSIARERILPFAGGWTGTRDLPAAPAGGTFMAAWAKRRAGG